MTHPMAGKGTRRAEPTGRDELLARIAADPRILAGKPVVRGTRIAVELVLGLLAQGVSAREILDDYPDLQEADIRACLAYAHAVIAGDRLDAVQAAEA
jgi:uncharacterized protein (DUF433 family)